MMVLQNDMLREEMQTVTIWLGLYHKLVSSKIEDAWVQDLDIFEEVSKEMTMKENMTQDWQELIH